MCPAQNPPQQARHGGALVGVVEGLGSISHLYPALRLRLRAGLNSFAPAGLNFRQERPRVNSKFRSHTDSSVLSRWAPAAAAGSFDANAFAAAQARAALAGHEIGGTIGAKYLGASRRSVLAAGETV